ncbi:hypothetical protein MLD38_040618 [Melastoma candidum]|nr:hypothetical protein MLD38_040618 [Melastoma candidum]
MPKERTIARRSSVSPYPCSAKVGKMGESSNPAIGIENVKEWDEARCPICMEHPHNAVLLICSSQEKGCRPYMCNTSHRHSNCLDQFCKSLVPSPSVIQLQQVPVSSNSSNMVSQSAISQETRLEQLMSNLPVPCADNALGSTPTLFCPFCRGHIYGWTVVESARRYMNSMPRGCSLETCKFTGTYSEHRKHARTEHPYTRPTEVDPSRRHEWARFERERELDDFRSTLESALGINENGSVDVMTSDDEGPEGSPFMEIDFSRNVVPFVFSYLTSVVSITEMIFGSLSGYASSDARRPQGGRVRRSTRRRSVGRYRSESVGTYSRRSELPRRRTNAGRLRWRDHRWPGNSDGR